MDLKVRAQQAIDRVREYGKSHKKQIVNALVGIVATALIASLVTAIILSTKGDFSKFSTSVAAKAAVKMYTAAVVSLVGLGGLIVAKKRMTKTSEYVPNDMDTTGCSSEQANRKGQVMVA